jgi:hypothetical protein
MIRSCNMRCRSFSLSICCCFRSSAAFIINSFYITIVYWLTTFNWMRTLSFFFRSGVRNPFFAFFARPASSNRLRTSAFFRSRSAAFFAAS